MSKRSLFWGQASGKLGEAVYYRAGGEQRTRTWVPKIKNPKTLAQMETRISMSNMVSMFRSYKSILSKSFPKRKTNQSGFNAFTSVNKTNRPYAIMPDDRDEGFFVPMGYQVAQGDIPISTQGVVMSRPNPADADEEEQVGFSFPGIMPSGVPFSFSAKNDELSTPLSPRRLYELMTGNGNPLGLPLSFKVTVMGGYLDVGYTNGSSANGSFSAAYIQYLCSADASEVNGPDIAVGATINTFGLKLFVGDVEDYNVPEGSETGTCTVHSIMTTQDTGINTTDFDLCCGLIISYTQDGTQRVTNSVMNYGEGLELSVKDSSKGGSAWNQVLDYYGYNAEGALATK